MLQSPTKAPEFSLQDAWGNTHSLRDYLGKPLLVFFYPKDDTPGCTMEACGFRDRISDLTQAGVVVIGISKDSPESHRAFAGKYALPFTLLSDPACNVIRAYGARSEKVIMGEKRETTLRYSYLIDPQGTIAVAYDNVVPQHHAAVVLRDVENLSKNW